ncbi:hypothetical protein F5884DRAFT_541939 [Xylogone sp. PMI_703]|nr:hypothetical protein F5884DRAFT_541939 [Xylogone sp. PMI_703]
MGQYWKVISPDQKEQLGTSLCGKLGEILPGGYAGRHLQQRLMVPLYKQRELVSGRSRFITNINIEQKLKAYLNELRAPTPTQRDEDTTAIEENLTTVFEKIYYRSWYKTSICLGDYFNKDDIPDLIRVLFDHFLGTWADRSIICVGDYSNKLPPGYQYSSDTLYKSQYRETLSLTDFAEAFLKNFKPQWPSKAQSFQEEYSRLFEEFFPSNQRHILLNLTSREYVISEELWGKELKKGYGYERPGLGDAAMTGICWSQDPSTSMRSNCVDTEGKWAGHRFIIISEPVFDEIMGREDWKDVSQNIYKVLDNIWESEEIPVSF